MNLSHRIWKLPAECQVQVVGKPKVWEAELVGVSTFFSGVTLRFNFKGEMRSRYIHDTTIEEVISHDALVGMLFRVTELPNVL